MTAQEWLDELERLRKAAVPGPWKHDKWLIKSLEARKIAQTINLDNAAYIVAACNAVPMLVEMLRIAVSLIEAQNAQRARKGERIPDGDVMQLIFTLTEPKE